jgi:hypothetical protein
MASCPRCRAIVTAGDIRRAKLDQPGSHCPACEVGLTIAPISWWRLAGVCAAVMALVVWISRDRLPESWGYALPVIAALAVEPLWWRFLVTLNPVDPPAASRLPPPGPRAESGRRQ